MTQFKPLEQEIYCIETGYIREQFAAMYLLRDADEVAVIETGTCHSLANLDAAMQALEIDPSQIKYVIPTHIHLDHAGGAGYMMERFAQAKLLIHPRGARHMIDPQKLIEGSIAVYGENRFRELYGDIKPIDEFRVIVVDDLDRYSVGSRELLFLDTPGHARHHFCVYDAQSEGIFSGDTFGSAYPPLKALPRGLIPTTTPVHFDPDALPASIDRLLSYQPRWMYLTHFGELGNPAAHAASLKYWIEQYVRLCESHAPDDSDAESAMIDAMRQLTLDELGKKFDHTRLLELLDVDIRLNVQGLAHWWRNSRHE